MADALPAPLLLSGESEAELRAGAGRLAEHLASRPELDPRDVAFTLSQRPPGHHRGAVLALGRDDLLAGLSALAEGRPAGGLHVATAREPTIAFLFSGQGAQRAGMGEGLQAAFPVYVRALEELLEQFDGLLERPLTEVMFAEPGSAEAELLDRTDFTQAALFTLEVSLFRLLEAFGLRPDFLIGHSIGELAAAKVAGMLPVADACRLVAARGRLMAGLPAGGAMLAVKAAEDEVTASLAPYEGRLGVAAVNSPRATVISGDEDAIEQWSAGWAERSKATRLRVSHAFHSPRTDPILDQLAEVAAATSFGTPSVPIVSNLTGEPLPDVELGSPGYWARQAREPVRFAAGIAFLAAQGANQYLELGPAPVLTAMAAECLEEGETDPPPLLACALRRRGSEPEALLSMLCEAHVHGADVDWAPLLEGSRPVELPGA